MRVIVYTTPNCPVCLITRNYLIEKQVQFEERNIFENKNFKDEVESIVDVVSLPVIVINNEVFCGFDKAKLDNLLKIAIKNKPVRVINFDTKKEKQEEYEIDLGLERI